MNAYRHVLAQRGVPGLFTALVTARLSTSVLSLSLLLAVREATGSYATASLALAGHGLSLAFLAPVLGRLCDRSRPGRVLLGALAAQALAYAGLITALSAHAPAAALIATTMLVGAFTPPGSAVARGTWPRLVPAERLPTAYALDAVSNEATFISGPLVVAAITAFSSPVHLIAAGAVATALGTVALALHPAVRHAPAGTAPDTCPRGLEQRLGPLAVPRVRHLLLIASAGTFCYGLMQVGAAAGATAWGATSSVGLIVSALSAGGVVGGLIYGGRRWPGDHRGHLTALYAASGAALFTAGAAPNLLALGVVYAVVGLICGGRDTVEQLLLGEAGPEHQRTEVFAWLGTFMWGGYSLGTASAGQLIPRFGTVTAYTTGGVVLLTAALAATSLRAVKATAVPAAGADLRG
ncbi:MFS transporter [Streptomyces monticola]|uniref:MFS transporter n=1 Tax=Streptomyces monticola TaxID=2666263 RepID=A0ABW2JRV0_9ACTN